MSFEIGLTKWPIDSIFINKQGVFLFLKFILRAKMLCKKILNKLFQCKLNNFGLLREMYIYIYTCNGKLKNKTWKTLVKFKAYAILFCIVIC